MFFAVRSNDSFNFALGLIKYIVIVSWVEFWHPADMDLWRGTSFIQSRDGWVFPPVFVVVVFVLRRSTSAGTGRSFASGYSVLKRSLGVYRLWSWRYHKRQLTFYRKIFSRTLPFVLLIGSHFGRPVAKFCWVYIWNRRGPEHSCRINTQGS